MPKPLPIPLPDGLLDELLGSLIQSARLELLIYFFQATEDQFISKTGPPYCPPQLISTKSNGYIPQDQRQSLRAYIFNNITILDLREGPTWRYRKALDLILQCPSLSNITTVHLGDKDPMEDLLSRAHERDSTISSSHPSKYQILNKIIQYPHFASLKTLSFNNIFKKEGYTDDLESLLTRMSSSPYLVGLEELLLGPNKMEVDGFQLLFGGYISSKRCKSPKALLGSHLKSLTFVSKTRNLPLQMINIICQLENLTYLSMHGRYSGSCCVDEPRILACLHKLERLIVPEFRGIHFFSEVTQMREFFWGREAIVGEDKEEEPKTFPLKELTISATDPGFNSFIFDTGSPHLDGHVTRKSELDERNDTFVFKNLTHLTMHNVEKNLNNVPFSLSKTPRTLNNLKYLDLTSNYINDEAFGRLMHCEWLSQLEELKLDSSFALTSQSISSLASSPYLTHLKHLDLSNIPGLDYKALEYLAKSPYLNKLERLILDSNERFPFVTTNNGLNALLTSPNLVNLSFLSLRRCGLHSDIFQTILNSDYLDKLEYIDLVGNNIDSNGIDLALSLLLREAVNDGKSPRLTNLKWIHLQENESIDTFQHPNWFKHGYKAPPPLIPFPETYPRDGGTCLCAYFPISYNENINGYFEIIL